MRVYPKGTHLFHSAEPYARRVYGCDDCQAEAMADSKALFGEVLAFCIRTSKANCEPLCRPGHHTPACREREAQDVAFWTRDCLDNSANVAAHSAKDSE